MSAGRDPVDRVIDLVVAAPLCTLVAVRRFVPVVAGAARRRLQVGDHRGALGNVGSTVDSTAREVPAHAPADEIVDPAVDAVVEAVVDALPIDGYDHLAARQVVDRLGSLHPDELDAVARYERTHRHRQTVLRKIEQLTS